MLKYFFSSQSVVGTSDEKVKTKFKKESTVPCKYVKKGYF